MEGRQSATVLKHPSSPTQAAKADEPPPSELPLADEFAVPDDLNIDERNVWLKLAPLAFKALTLHRASEERFKLLCKNIVREKALAVTDLGSGKHRGIMQLVERGLDAFLLGAYGRPSAKPAISPAVNDDDAFFSGGARG